jgi:mannitol-specific phosphotransferase system IIBC component
MGQAKGGPVDPVVQILLQSGVAGLVAVVAGFVIKSLFTKMEEDHDQEIVRLTERAERAEARGDRYESELSKLNQAVQSGYVDTIVRANAAIGEASRAVADALAALRRS